MSNSRLPRPLSTTALLGDTLGGTLTPVVETTTYQQSTPPEINVKPRQIPAYTSSFISDQARNKCISDMCEGIIRSMFR